MVWHLASAEACRNGGADPRDLWSVCRPESQWNISLGFEIILDDSGKKPLGHSQRTPTYKVSAQQYSAALTNSEA